MVYRALDIFFFVFHSAFILFILTGWAWKRTRLAHLVAVGLTALSWFGLGIWYGFGYCPFTDWHWQVRYALGYLDLPSSYIKFFIDTLTAWDVNAMLVDIITVAALILASGSSIYLNLRDRTEKWRQLPIFCRNLSDQARELRRRK
jgi:hypothetical protein